MSSPALKLPLEIWHLILSHLDVAHPDTVIIGRAEGNTKALYDLCLTNHYICEITRPYLYSWLYADYKTTKFLRTIYEKPAYARYLRDLELDRQVHGGLDVLDDAEVDMVTSLNERFEINGKGPIGEVFIADLTGKSEEKKNKAVLRESTGAYLILYSSPNLRSLKTTACYPSDTSTSDILDSFFNPASANPAQSCPIAFSTLASFEQDFDEEVGSGDKEGVFFHAAPMVEPLLILPKLKKLILKNNLQMTLPAPSYAAERMTNIEELRLEPGYWCLEYLEAVLKRMPKLRVLSVHGLVGEQGDEGAPFGMSAWGSSFDIIDDEFPDLNPLNLRPGSLLQVVWRTVRDTVEELDLELVDGLGEVEAGSGENLEYLALWKGFKRLKRARVGQQAFWTLPEGVKKEDLWPESLEWFRCDPLSDKLSIGSGWCTPWIWEKEAEPAVKYYYKKEWH